MNISWYNPFQLHESVLLFSAIPTENHNSSDLEAAFLQQVSKLKQEPLTERELKRVKINVIAEQIFTKDSMSEQATDLGLLESIGLSWKEIERFPEKIEAITANDVRNVANKYLVSERLTTANLIPLAKKGS